MHIRVNKNTANRPQNVKYAALSTGTISHVWYDEDTSRDAKRQNRIKMTRASESREYDA